MSERDSKCKRGDEAMLTIAIVAMMLIFFITIVGLQLQSEIRDLQRRVGQLETERR